jgi:hypothetical protein
MQVLQCGEQQARDHHGREGGAGCGRHPHLAKAETITVIHPPVFFFIPYRKGFIYYIYILYIYNDVFL